MQILSDWQGWVMPGAVLIVYAGWGVVTLRQRMKRSN